MTLVYGQPSAVHVDPIEKKPLFHYYPGSRALSLATAGCNFNCRFCQNWEISQRRPEQLQTIDLLPEAVIRQARSNGCRVVAHTYNEPVVFFEYVRDCAALGREQGVPNVMISNGFIAKEPMRELCRYLGAVKIDLKAFRKTFYIEQCGGLLQPVLDTLLNLRGGRDLVRDRGAADPGAERLAPGDGSHVPLAGTRTGPRRAAAFFALRPHLQAEERAAHAAGDAAAGAAHRPRRRHPLLLRRQPAVGRRSTPTARPAARCCCAA